MSVLKRSLSNSGAGGLLLRFSAIMVLILSDQLLKLWLIKFLKTQPGYSITLTPYFNIVYVWNYGISFGLFANYYQYSNYVLATLNCFIVLYLLRILIISSKKYQSYGLLMIISGALGNIVDRLIHGAVFDFIHLHYHNFHYPAFNLADIFITLGVILLFGSYLREYFAKN